MLVTPMRTGTGHHRAIQLINKKRDPSARLASKEEVDRQVAASTRSTRS